MASNNLRVTPTNYNYVNSLLGSTFSLHEPTVDSQYITPFGTQSITGLMDELGSINEVSSLEYRHMEQARIHETVYFEAASAGSANAAVTYTFSTATATNSVYTYPNTAQSPYVVAGNTTTVAIQANDVVMFPDGTKGFVNSVNTGAGTCSISPTVSGSNLPAIAETDAIVILGTLFGEASDGPSSRNSTMTMYTNNLMIHRRANTYTGTEAAVKTWVEFQGKKLWYLQSQRDEAIRFANECEMMMLTGEKLTNTTLAANIPTTTSTEGLFPWIEAYGNVQNYNSTIGFQLADLDSLIDKLSQQKGVKENFMYLGLELDRGIDNFLMDMTQNGAIQYNAFQGIGGKDRAIEFGFKSFQRSGYTFHKMQYELFNDIKLLGAIPKYRKYAVVIPSGNATAADEKGQKLTVPSMRINYLGANGYSRYNEEYITGGANGVYTNRNDSVTVDMLAHRGFEGFGANRFAVIDAA